MDRRNITVGIRPKVVVGYGLVDVEVKDDEIVDSRFNSNWNKELFYNTDKQYYKLENFYKAVQSSNKYSEAEQQIYFTQRNHKRQQFLQPHKVPKGLDCVFNRFVTWDPEYGDPSVLVLRSLTESGWERYDDPIDHYIISTTPKYTLLDAPLYPCYGYIDKRTGEKVDTTTREEIQDVRMLTKSSNKKQYEEYISALLEEIGCKESWEERFNYDLPLDIIEFCRYTEMFVEENTIYTLKPMVYSFWS